MPLISVSSNSFLEEYIIILLEALVLVAHVLLDLLQTLLILLVVELHANVVFQPIYPVRA